MNKKFVKETIGKGQKITTYSEEFNPQDIQIKYYSWDGKICTSEDGEEVKSYNFEAVIPGIDMLDVRSIKFPEFNYRTDEFVKVVVVEYDVVDEIANV